MGNYSWSEKKGKKRYAKRMFYIDEKCLDKTCYMAIFKNLIKTMGNHGFEVKPFEFIPGITNLRIDLEDKLTDSNKWSNLTDSLRASNTSDLTTSIVRFGVSPESLKNYDYNIFLNLTLQFIKAIQDRNENFLMAKALVRWGSDVYHDFWFDYTI